MFRYQSNQRYHLVRPDGICKLGLSTDIRQHLHETGVLHPGRLQRPD